VYDIPNEIFKMGHTYCYGKRDNVRRFLKFFEIGNMLPDVRYVTDVPHCSYEFYKAFMKGLFVTV
jgi:hypothetical protein